MKLLTETIEEIEFLTEETNGTKQQYISGRFMVAESINGNGRIYPRDVLSKEVTNYQSVINENKSVGELNHPSSPSINLDRVSHLITELKMDGNYCMGKAKILDTPMGKITKDLISGGVKLGVSSRGLGSIREDRGSKIVQPDFKLMAIDIVGSPSGPGCYVESLVENVEWYFDGIDWVKREAITEEIKSIKNIKNRELREQQFLKAFSKFLS